MRFAVVVPTFTGDTVPKTVSDLRYPNFQEMLDQMTEANQQINPPQNLGDDDREIADDGKERRMLYKLQLYFNIKQ